MAEILIPVKNPPKNCHECKNGWCNLWEQNKNMATGKHPDCPMKELPPHGDLIDRQKLLEHRFEVYDSNEEVCEDYIETYHVLEAPSIVEASKERA